MHLLIDTNCDECMKLRLTLMRTNATLTRDNQIGNGSATVTVARNITDLSVTIKMKSARGLATNFKPFQWDFQCKSCVLIALY